MTEIKHVRAVFVAEFGNGFPTPTDLTLLGPREPAQLAHQTGLPATIAPLNLQEPARVNAEAHAAKQAPVAANAFELRGG
jgi:hypothetical protein